jgi:hypothetical protein
MTVAAGTAPFLERLEPAACIGAGWRAFWRRPGLGLALVLPFALTSLLDLVPEAGDVLSFLIGPVLSGGAARLVVRMVEDRGPRFGDLFAGFARAVTLVIAQLLYLLVLVGVLAPVILPIVLAGDFEDPSSLLLAVMGSALLLPVLPVAIFLALRFAFLPYLIVESRPVGVLDAFARSWTMTRRVSWRLFGLLLLTAVLQVAGILALLVGVLVTLPVGLLAWGAAYVRLRPADLAPPAAIAPVTAPPVAGDAGAPVGGPPTAEPWPARVELAPAPAAEPPATQ